MPFREKGPACPRGQARKKPGAVGVPLNNMVRTVDRTPAGLCAWFSVSVPVHHMSWARLGVDSAVYTRGEALLTQCRLYL